MMKKKLALVIISINECFGECFGKSFDESLAPKGFSGGGHKVTRNLILELIKSGLFEIDIFCRKGVNGGVNGEYSLDGINSITVLDNKKTFSKDLFEQLNAKNYDYVLSSDILLPGVNNIVHSNSSKYKSKNGKNKLMQQILKVYNAKKIKAQEKCLINNDKALFTVSESLKKDFVENFNLDENKVFVCIPAVDDYSEFVEPEIKEEFTIGSIAGGGLNKGGYLLLLALKQLPKNIKLKARVIFPKIKKAFFFKSAVKLLGLSDRVEILPKQQDMSEYYKIIDCYILPSLNEAFGLVVTEAASKFKPSIVSSTAGARELIVDGENGFPSGFIFDREKNPIQNLSNKIMEVYAIYFNDHEKFIEISKNAHLISTKLDWKKFADIIINNMVEENKGSKT